MSLWKNTLSNFTKNGIATINFVILTPYMNRMFWFCFIISSIVVFIFLVFFFIGLTDNTVGESNIASWLGILLAGGVILFSSYYLHTIGKNAVSILILSPSTIFGVVGLLYILVIMIFSKPGMWR